MELRARLALAPDQVPEPPVRDRRAPGVALIGRFGAVGALTGRFGSVMALAGVGAFLFLWLTALPSAPAQPQVALRAETLPVPEAPATRLLFKSDQVPQGQRALTPFSAAEHARDLTGGDGGAASRGDAKRAGRRASRHR